MKNIYIKLASVLFALVIITLLLPVTFGGDPGLTGQILEDKERYFHRLKDMRAKDPQNPEWSYQLGNLYYSLEMENDAIKEYRRTLKLDPEHAFAKWFLSKVLESRGYYEEAFWLVRELIRKHNQIPELYDRAGEILIKMEQNTAAREYFARYDELKFGEVRGEDPVKTKTRPTAGSWKEYFY
ncbi:MAG: tetratricopeptide repeat protein [Candidatus Rifleibacteriota bacterium]